MGTPTTLRLTPRDVEILLMIYRYDGCISTQIQRRFWPQIGARSAYYDRVGRLLSDGYLRRIALPSISGYGSGPSLLTLGPRSHPILTTLLDLRPTDLRRLRTRLQPAFWPHDGAVRDLHLDVELACAATGVELVEWMVERDLQRTPIVIARSHPQRGRAADVVPDGAFILRLRHGSEQGFLVELDRATVPPSRIRPKLRTYLLNAVTDPRPVLWVVPSGARRDQLLAWTLALATELAVDPTVIWVAVRPAVSAASVLAHPIWAVAGGPAAHALIPSTALTGAEAMLPPTNGKVVPTPWTSSPAS